MDLQHCTACACWSPRAHRASGSRRRARSRRRRAGLRLRRRQRRAAPPLPPAIPRLQQTVCDVADPAAVAHLFETASATLGGLDVLVNNAGIAGPTAACEDIALADWERTLAVNLTGQFLCAQRAIPLLKASRNASIANLSSAAGRFGFPLRTPTRPRNGA